MIVISRHRWRHLIGTGFLVFGGVSIANAQTPSLLAQVSVTPLPGETGCYAGTAGEDHTMFLRDLPLQNVIPPYIEVCDDLAGRRPCLSRREFPSDGPDGRHITLLAAILLRPSVSGNGQSVYFTEWAFNVCGMNTNERLNEGCFGRDFLGFDPHSIAVSPLGSPVAIVVLDQNFNPSNFIVVANAVTQAIVEQHLVQVTGPGGTVLQVESMDFSVNGRWILVDALNPVTGLWGIYAVERSTGNTRTVVAPVAGLHLRNASFAQTSDDYITFDAQDPSTLANTIFTANVLTGALVPVASTAILGFPSYTGDDAAIVFTDFDATTLSRASLDRQGLAGDRLTAQGARTRWLTDAGVGVIYRRGNFDATLLDPLLCPAPSTALLNAAALVTLAFFARRAAKVRPHEG